MASASLTADLLVRKGGAQPIGKWMRSTSVTGPTVQAKPVAQKPRKKGPLVTKTLRLDKTVNRQLKLLAARADISQQTVMEEAVRHYVAVELEKADCVCGADIVPVG